MTKDDYELFSYGNDATISGCYGKVTNLVIPEGITEISKDAFRGRRGLKTVRLPNSLRIIGANAFASTGLESVELPANVYALSVAPFCFCYHLKNIYVHKLNSTFQSIDGVLLNNHGKVLVQYPAGREQECYVIPDGVEFIAPKAFSGCKHLKQIEIPRSMTTISPRAFSGCYGLEGVVIPDWITRIESQAFAYCTSLKKITMRQGIYVEHGAFTDCNELKLNLIKSETELNNEDLDLKIRIIEKKYVEEPNIIVLSKTVRSKNLFAKEAQHTFATKCEEMGRGKVREYMSYLTEDADYLDETGIIKVGTLVKGGDILVAKGRLKNAQELTREERLLNAICGSHGPIYADESLHVPYDVEGEVTDVKIEYEKDKHGNIVLGKHIDQVSIVITQKYPVDIGDILVDENGNEGIVFAFDENMPDYDIVANFPFGSKITKKSIAQCTWSARSTGSYALFGNYPLATRESFGAISHVVSGIPQELDNKDINKLINNGYYDVLQNILLFQADQPKNRARLNHALRRRVSTRLFFLPDDINGFICFFKALCIKPIFRDKAGKEIPYSYVDDDFELNNQFGNYITLELDVLTDDEIRAMSHGEVIKGETIDYHTHIRVKGGIFCEKIFGAPYSIAQYEWFGHIVLSEPIPHPIFPNRMLAVIPVLPPELRPIGVTNSNKIVSSDLNELYRVLINCNNRLKRGKELGVFDARIQSDRKKLVQCVNALFEFQKAKSNIKSLSNRTMSLFKKHLICEPLDYSAACRVVIDETIPDGQCGLPLKIAIELFKPFLIKELRASSVLSYQQAAEQLIALEATGRNGDLQGGISAQLSDLIQHYKILVLSREGTGEVLALTPRLTHQYVLTVNSNQYRRFKPLLDESVKIIFPISQAAQDMLWKSERQKHQVTSIFELEDSTDFVKDLSMAAMEERDITKIFVDAVLEHRVCKFETAISRYLFGKPSAQVWGFYKLPSKPTEVEKPSKNYGDDSEEILSKLLNFDPDEETGDDDNGEGLLFNDDDLSDVDEEFRFSDLFDDEDDE